MKKILLSTALLALMAGPAFAEGDGKHRGHKIDTDGDGYVSKSEFMAAHEKKFEKMDTNNDGKISKEEREKAKEHWKKKRSEWKEKRKEWKEKHKKDSE